MTSLKHSGMVVAVVSFLLCATPPVSAWVLVLNGTTSAGKTTLAKNFQKMAKQATEHLQWDVEVTQVRKEALEAIGYRYLEEPDFWGWADSLSEDVKKRIDASALENTAKNAATKRVIEKAQTLARAGMNVIVDTPISNKTYKYFKTSAYSKHTYFILVYAPIDQLLKHVQTRNGSGIRAEKRKLLWSFKDFLRFFEPCDATSPKMLDVLTKETYETVFKELEGLVESKDQDDLKKTKLTFERTLFGGCRDVVGIALRPPPYDFVINTGTTSPAECAEKLHAWLTQLEPVC